jgi:hypothetical protein
LFLQALIAEEADVTPGRLCGRYKQACAVPRRPCHVDGFVDGFAHSVHCKTSALCGMENSICLKSNPFLGKANSICRKSSALYGNAHLHRDNSCVLFGNASTSHRKTRLI